MLWEKSSPTLRPPKKVPPLTILENCLDMMLQKFKNMLLPVLRDKAEKQDNPYDKISARGYVNI